MSVRRFGIVITELDPIKFGKLVQKGLIKELSKDTNNGISYIESG